MKIRVLLAFILRISVWLAMIALAVGLIVRFTIRDSVERLGGDFLCDSLDGADCPRTVLLHLLAVARKMAALAGLSRNRSSALSWVD